MCDITEEEFKLYCKDANLQPLQDGTFKCADGSIEPLVGWRVNVDFQYEVYFYDSPLK